MGNRKSSSTKDNCCSIVRVWIISISNNYFTTRGVKYCWRSLSITRIKCSSSSKTNTSTRYSTWNYFSKTERVLVILISNNYFTISGVKYCWDVISQTRIKYNFRTKANASTGYSAYDCCSIIRVSSILITNNYFIIGRVICYWSVFG